MGPASETSQLDVERVAGIAVVSAARSGGYAAIGGTTLARQILSAVDEMTPPQRLAAGEVIGQALIESDHLPDLKTQVIGELWIRDLELTVWHVLHADRR
ncbi:hypothetical protein [Streptomyces sp. VB1]|uniref:hypothetical protein n=1 Tax=Streptomyces sp. VB1 TaxID=2986803 RepID=UPI00224222A5|nr:hypothetical protein [Streptomyces sp. VB1]UZI29732.1 hypothetical protein OH133_17250 [Streptomyces sp. VB1]